MTLDNDLIPPGSDPAREAIDALLDGELADKEALRSALAEADTRDYFIDALLLRHLATEMAPPVSDAPTRADSRLMRPSRWIAAAVVVAGTALAGYAVGRGSISLARVDETVEQATVSPPVPEATTTIRFERGTNWISTLERN